MDKLLKQVRDLLREQGVDPKLADKTLGEDHPLPQELLDTISAVLDGFETKPPESPDTDKKK